MCTKEEVREEIKTNNKEWDKKFFDLKETIFIHTQKLMEHSRTSPETEKALAKIKEHCAERGICLAKMEAKQEEVLRLLKDSREERKAFESSMIREREKLVDHFYKVADSKADKEDVKKVEENISWVSKLVIGAVIVAILAVVVK